MKTLIRCIVIAPLALIGALPAVAASSQRGLPAVANVKMAAADASTTDHSTYAQKARADVLEWRRKLDEFGKTAEAKGKEARKAAMDDLDAAWTKVRDASAKLETAGTAGWASAKASFENASDAMSETWKKARAEIK
jgi:hypothetical protein